MSRAVTLEQIEAEITSEHFFTADCGVVGQTLRNGFTVTGQSACADPATFDAQKGREIARADAIL